MHQYSSHHFLIIYYCGCIVSALNWSIPYYVSHRKLSHVQQPALLPPFISQYFCSNLQYDTNRRNGDAQLFSASSTFPVSSNSIEIPILPYNVQFNTNDESMLLQPLPSSHLPNELSTPFVYGLPVSTPLVREIVQHAMEEYRLVGMMAFESIKESSSSSSLVGAVGCSTQILYYNDIEEEEKDGDDTTTTTTIASSMIRSSALCRGYERFIVEEVVQTIPYTVVRVRPLHDTEMGDTTLSERSIATSWMDSDIDNEESNDEDDDDDNDDNDTLQEFAHLTPTELTERTLLAVQRYLDFQVEQTENPTELSPLEASILEESHNLSQQQVAAAAARQAAQENAAVFTVFRSDWKEMCPSLSQQYFALAFLAAELTDFDNDSRRRILRMTHSLERLRYVCQCTEQVMGMIQARRMADSITDKTSEASKNLKVGSPTLPQWARQICKGTAIEYYWNEEWGWCKGEVVEDPVLVVDELILTVYFPMDGSTQRLPFSGDEKVRWRPAVL